MGVGDVLVIKIYCIAKGDLGGSVTFEQPGVIMIQTMVAGQLIPGQTLVEQCFFVPELS